MSTNIFLQEHSENRTGTFKRFLETFPRLAVVLGVLNFLLTYTLLTCTFI